MENLSHTTRFAIDARIRRKFCAFVFRIIINTKAEKVQSIWTKLKSELQRALNVQITMDRIERQLDGLSAEILKRGKVEKPKDIDDLLGMVDKYDNILDHLVKQNSKLKALYEVGMEILPKDEIRSPTDLSENSDYIKDLKATKYVPSLRDHSPNTPVQASTATMPQTLVSEERRDISDTYEKLSRDLTTNQQPTSPTTLELDSRFSIPERPSIDERQAYLRNSYQKHGDGSTEQISSPLTTSVPPEPENPSIEEFLDVAYFDRSSQLPTTSFLDFEDDDDLSPAEQARQLLNRVNDMYQQSKELQQYQELRAQNLMRRGLSKIKMQYLLKKQKEELESKYKKSLEQQDEKDKNMNDTTVNVVQGIKTSDYRIENGVIILDDEESPEPLETDERGLPNLLKKNKKKGTIMETQDGDKWIIHLENVDSEIDSSSIIDVKSKMCCM